LKFLVRAIPRRFFPAILREQVIPYVTGLLV
jgi:hypothetical protein